MTFSSHRLRVEEKKVFRKLVTSLVILILAAILIIYAGIPLLTKAIIFLTSTRSGNSTVNNTEVTLINPPILDPLADATNSSPILVSGIADNEATVKILINDIEVAKVLADKDAKFTAKNIKLSEGTNNITAVTIENNQESSPSEALVINFIKNPPKLDISSPSDGQKIISDSNLTISGETDPGDKVTINDRFVIVNSTGKFEYKVNLSGGDNNFKIIATDPAGNQTTIERKVTFTP